ncbi:DUF1168-domain-containing protein [Sistotremastrum niveocremeum HHB9708]|uniref:DUF1168-domain-containing protein n=2 Tax=Sistotremastraceae TaxID=3402574 RepID=A0A165A0A0_9AGAM|nr:DUF1168-domain-containing protein [Sistotremastrum niveocremeum HHB9708]KZT41462.1 DUF1168-domain-containing protein [Sistotremastrum suecicum HHB10207 ss-3]
MSATNEAAASTTTVPATSKHATTALDKQRNQLARLLKDPAKPAFIPPPPKEKTIRPARDMIKNVQGSSAGAGSGEFHVYKANRRREYERLKIMEEEAQKEAETLAFEKAKREREEAAEAKTAKNRARRQKKKERGAHGGEKKAGSPASTSQATTDAPIKKRRLINGKEIIFKLPGEDDSSGDEDNSASRPAPPENIESHSPTSQPPEASASELSSVAQSHAPKITIIED